MSHPGSFEEPPVLLWGLDPVFRAFAKLYIKDILELKQSEKVSGVFFYKRHPIKQVDILGIVVDKREKENFYRYGVDDSTGVISCTCWKKSCLLENSSFGKVEDPACDAQIFRMLDVPYLYRNVYDLPFETSQDRDDNIETTASVTHQLSEQVEDFLTKNTIQNFYPRELETVDSLMSLINEKLRETQVNQSCPTTKEVRSLFTDAIGVLQKKGVVFLKSQKHDVYHTTDQDKELHKTTLSIIQADCKRHRHAEKGCHILHILNCVRQTYSSGVSEAVMKRVLNTLESDSQIVSTMELHYTVF